MTGFLRFFSVLVRVHYTKPHIPVGIRNPIGISGIPGHSIYIYFPLYYVIPIGLGINFIPGIPGIPQDLLQAIPAGLTGIYIDVTWIV
jgi:hypothetical protein